MTQVTPVDSDESSQSIPQQIFYLSQPNAHQIIRVSSRQWFIGLCGCCSDCSECCYAFWCLPCYTCSLFSRTSEDCCSWCFGGLIPLRTKIRAERGIEGSICCDYWAINCCLFCAAVQMGKEIKETLPVV